MRKTVLGCAALALAACTPRPPAPPEPEVPVEIEANTSHHLAPQARPFLPAAPLTLVNALEWDCDRQNWTQAASQVHRLLDTASNGLVQFPRDSRRWIPAWRYVVERSKQLPAEFIDAYRAAFKETFEHKRARAATRRERLEAVRRYFLCEGADALADAVANEALEDGDRWLAADLWHLVYEFYPATELDRDVLLLRRRWAMGRDIAALPGTIVGDARRSYQLPHLGSTNSDTSAPTPLDKALPEEEPGFEHSHAFDDRLSIRFTREGLGEPLLANVVTPSGTVAIAGWYRERQRGDNDPDKFLRTYRSCNPTAIVSDDRAWILTGFGFVACVSLSEPSIEWIVEYPRDGVWREASSARIDKSRLVLLPPDASQPCVIQVVTATPHAVAKIPETLRGTLEQIGEDSFVIRLEDGERRIISFEP